MKTLKDPFWNKIAIDISTHNHPSDWNESVMVAFLDKMDRQLLKICKNVPAKAKLCKVPFIKGRYAFEQFSSISPTSFRRIFQYEKSRGKVTTKHLFAIYLGYDSFQDYINKNEIQLNTRVKQYKRQKINILPSLEVSANKNILFFHVYLSNGDYFIEPSVKLNDQPSSSITSFEPFKLRLSKAFFAIWDKFNEHRRKVWDEESVILRNKDGKRTHSISIARNRYLSLEEQLGVELYNTFFPVGSKSHSIITEHLDLLKGRELDDLTIIIASKDSSVSNLPFELMRENIAEPPFSIKHENLLIAHSLETKFKSFSKGILSPLQLPLRVLFVTALPGFGNNDLIDLEAEQEAILKSIDQANTQIIKSLGDLTSKKRIVIEFLEIGSLNALEEALSQGKHHILHISGHGFFYDEDNTGYLNLETDHGDLAQVSSSDLAKRLIPFTKHLKLVLLAACETGRLEIQAGAGAITQIGIPIVIALRYPATDKSVTLFTSKFYHQICLGLSIHEAIFHARRDILNSEIQERKRKDSSFLVSEWLTPFLYLSQSIENLIDVNLPVQDTPYFSQIHRAGYHFPGVKNEALEYTAAKLVAKGFIGRRKQLIELNNLYKHSHLYSSKAKTICIHGMGGLGKTSLAARFLDNYNNKGYEIIVIVGQTNEYSILKKIIASARPEEKEALNGIIENSNLELNVKLNLIAEGYLSTKNIILFFDNFEDNIDLKNKNRIRIDSNSLVDFLKRLCIIIQKSINTVFLLFTCRYRIDQLPLYFLDLEKMSFADTYKLINRSKGLVSLNLKQRQEVHKRLGGHPRAIELLNSYFQSDTNAEWRDIVSVFQNVEDFLTKHDLLLDLLWRKLTPAEKEILSMASIFRSLNSVKGIVAIGSYTHSKVKKTLVKIQALSLVYLEKNSFWVHQLTSQWTLSKNDFETKKNWHFKAAEYLINCTKDNEDDPAVVDVETSLDIIWHFRQGEFWNDAADVTISTEEGYRKAGNYTYAKELVTAALNTEIIAENEAILFNRLGLIQKQLGEYIDAVVSLTKSIEKSKEIQHEKAIIINLREIGSILNISGDHETALDNYHEAIQLAIKYGFKDELAAIYLQIGSIHQKQGKDQEAKDSYIKSLNLAMETNFPEGVASAYHSLGTLQEALGSYDTALEYYEKALEISKKINDYEFMQNTYHHLGVLEQLRGKPENSLNYLFSSLKTSKHFQDTKGECSTLSQIGSAFLSLGNYEEADHYFSQSFSIASSIGFTEGVILGLINGGMVNHIRGENDKAIERLESALKSSIDYLFFNHQAVIYRELGNIYAYGKNDLDQALIYTEQSISSFEKTSDIKNLGSTFHLLGNIYLMKHDLVNAETYINKGMAIRMMLNNDRGRLQSLISLGDLEQRKTNFVKAFEYYDQALQISREIHDFEGEASTLQSMSDAYIEQGEYEKALISGTEAVLITSSKNSPNTFVYAQKVLELEQFLPARSIYEYLKSKDLDIQYLEEE